MTSLTLPAYAKINLALDIIGKRDDGYHLLRMIMQKVSLADEITICQMPEGQGGITCSSADLPLDEGNMAWRAFCCMKNRFQLPGSALIHVEKRIPIAAGLAGGSSNAATVIEGTTRLWQLPLTLAEKQEIGLSLGSDVPFCFLQDTALAEGIGDILTPLPKTPPFWVVLANPGFPVETGEIFRQFSFEAKGTPPDLELMLNSLAKGDAAGILQAMNNVLESVTLVRFPAVAQLKEEMAACGLTAMMSGSGPTVMGLTLDHEQAQAAVVTLTKRWPWVFLARTI